MNNKAFNIEEAFAPYDIKNIASATLCIDELLKSADYIICQAPFTKGYDTEVVSFDNLMNTLKMSRVKIFFLDFKHIVKDCYIRLIISYDSLSIYKILYEPLSSDHHYNVAVLSIDGNLTANICMIEKVQFKEISNIQLKKFLIDNLDHYIASDVDFES